MIERWRLEKISVNQIAALLKRHRSTIYSELKRGTVTNLRSDLTRYRVYRAQRAHDDCLSKSGAGGAKPKLVWNSQIANKLGTLMRINKMSPYAAMETAKREKLDVPISLKSFYNYIHQYNYPIACHQLPMKNKTGKKKAKGTSRLAHHNVEGVSIEKRQEKANTGAEAGHWEMDLVVGAKGGKKVLLVLTERKTRYEYIILLKDKSQKSVIQALNRLERKYGTRLFRKTFKTVTCDNGSEFLDLKH